MTVIKDDFVFYVVAVDVIEGDVLVDGDIAVNSCREWQVLEWQPRPHLKDDMVIQSDQINDSLTYVIPMFPFPSSGTILPDLGEGACAMEGNIEIT